MSDKQPEFDHVDFMKHPYLWPHLILPVKRVREGDLPEVGVMLGDKPVVYLRSMFELGKLEEADREVYEIYEDVYEAGWRVD